jgi:hypothetical protein
LPEEEPGAFDAEPGVLEPVGVAAGFVAEEPEPDASEPEEEPAEAAPEEEVALAAVDAPSSWTPVPSLQALRESAASATVTAAPARRVREVRRADMWLCPFGVRVGVVIG